MLGIKSDCGSSDLRRKLSNYNIKNDFFRWHFYLRFRQRSVDVANGDEYIFSIHNVTKRQARFLAKQINWAESGGGIVASVSEWDK